MTAVTQSGWPGLRNEAPVALTIKPGASKTQPRPPRWRVAVWVVLGLVIVAHGCHADRDTELRARPAVAR
jgi:hypothetical protein